jgi:hypothetical protein
MLSSTLAPWVPDESDPFDRRKAAHLLRRAGFGAAPSEIDKAVAQGLEATVEGLFDEADDEEQEFQKTFAAINGRLANFADDDNVRAWWVYRMRRTRAPLREKLTLFWHGHFATSQGKVDNIALLHRQIETIRRHAWGNFRDLCLAMARDPAMLVWLDGESSTKEHPNENFARELMELFTCGIGHYTEKDVQEAARAFTGWHRDGAAFTFNANAHDSGRKHFLGKSGRFDGTDVIDILMQQPATLRFLARKLLRFFAEPEPSGTVLDEAAALLDRTRLDVKWFLRDFFLSRYFFSDECLRQRLASPVEYVVGTLRTLDVRWPATEAVGRLSAMGQTLLAPPNVKGWDGEEKWINSSTWAARIDFARTIAELAGGNEFDSTLDLGRVVPPDLNDPVKVIDRLADVLLQGDLSDETRRELVKVLTSTGTDPGDDAAAKMTTLSLGRLQLMIGTVKDKDKEPDPVPDDAFRDDEGTRNERTRRVLGVILSLPEYHAY